MDRRSFLQMSVPAVLASGLLSRVYPLAHGSRPNILLISSDQQFGDAMSCAGNTDMHTPNMDWLAENGVRFSKAYCPFPLCLPTRSSWVMGRYPHEVNAWSNRAKSCIPSNALLLGKALKNAGYATGWVGKWHLGMSENDKSRHGLDYVNIHTNEDYTKPGEAEQFLSEARSKPFFLHVAFHNPHDICCWARMESGIKDNLRNGPIGTCPSTDQCPELPGNYDVPDDEPGCIRQALKSDRQIHPVVGWKSDKWRRYRWAYARMVEKVDSEIGKVLDTLRQSGLEENTVILFICDHGDGMGAHQWNQKWVLYEESVRVPLIITPPGLARAGTVSPYLVNLGIDLYPTICDYAGAEPPPGLSGKSLKGVVSGNIDGNSRPCIAVETNMHGTHGRCLVSNKAKYMIYAGGSRREQLFDLAADPGEMNNLAAKSEYKDLLNEHRYMLANWAKESGDKNFEYMPYEVPTSIRLAHRGHSIPNGQVRIYNAMGRRLAGGAHPARNLSARGLYMTAGKSGNHKKFTRLLNR